MVAYKNLLVVVMREVIGLLGFIGAILVGWVVNFRVTRTRGDMYLSHKTASSHRAEAVCILQDLTYSK